MTARYIAVRGKLDRDDARAAYVTHDGRPVASFWFYEEAVRYAARCNASPPVAEPVPENERGLWPEAQARARWHRAVLAAEAKVAAERGARAAASTNERTNERDRP